MAKALADGTARVKIRGQIGLVVTRECVYVFDTPSEGVDKILAGFTSATNVNEMQPCGGLITQRSDIDTQPIQNSVSFRRVCKPNSLCGAMA